MKRRTFLTGCVAAGAGLAMPALAAPSGSRTFRVLRGGKAFGSHVLEAVQVEDRFEIAITIKLAVKVLGVTAYRYELDNREIWQGGRLISVDSRVNNDGDDEFVRAKRAGDVLKIEGSGFDGTAPGLAATTSYYTPTMLERRPWISTQSGKPLEIAIGPEGRSGWWSVTGGLDTKLGYDSRGEWIGCEFDAGGEPGRYEVAAESGTIGALWSAV